MTAMPGTRWTAARITAASRRCRRRRRTAAQPTVRRVKPSRVILPTATDTRGAVSSGAAPFHRQAPASETIPMNDIISFNRRAFLAGGAAAASMAGLYPAWAKTISHGIAGKGVGDMLRGNDIALTIAETAFNVDGRAGHAVASNVTIPAPLIRLREGENVRLAVTNHLDEDTSIHWHGLIVPFEMDGVPGVSFP